MKITVKDFQPDPLNPMEPELQALYKLVDEFTLEMKGKLFRKFHDGWKGWDLLSEDTCMECLRMQLVKYPQDPADIGNFAAFLFNARR